jgi:hypothetical protein
MPVLPPQALTPRGRSPHHHSSFYRFRDIPFRRFRSDTLPLTAEHDKIYLPDA